MRLKNSSVVFDVRAPLLYALWRIEIVMAPLGDVILTSVNDGHHMPQSLHYRGMAADFRSKHLAQNQKLQVIFKLKSVLGPDYDVLLENEGKDNEHFHVEFDPKMKVA